MVTLVGKGHVSESATSLSQGVKPLIYANTVLSRAIKFRTIIHVEQGMFLGVSHTASQGQGEKNFDGATYTFLYHLTSSNADV